MTPKTFTASAFALLMLTGSAAAVTVTNNSGEEISIGIDRGAKEQVEQIAPGKSLKVDCQEQCGITGPWGFSWLAKGDDKMETDGSRLVAPDQG